jgi:MFS family permease
LLAQAICIGLGAGCLSIPAVAILPQYFTTKKALATGLATSGSSLGGTVYPIIFQQLQPKIGFAWATRVLGFISLGTCLFSILVMRIRQIPKEKRSLLEPAAFKEAPYSLFCATMFFVMLVSSAQSQGSQQIRHLNLTFKPNNLIQFKSL